MVQNTLKTETFTKYLHQNTLIFITEHESLIEFAYQLPIIDAKIC